jgi:hypothetical protein
MIAVHNRNSRPEKRDLTKIEPDGNSPDGWEWTTTPVQGQTQIHANSHAHARKRIRIPKKTHTHSARKTKRISKHPGWNWRPGECDDPSPTRLKGSGFVFGSWKRKDPAPPNSHEGELGGLGSFPFGGKKTAKLR